MDALVMCGGQGSRLDAPVEKPLFEVRGQPLVEHVHTALANSSIDTIYAVPSPQTPHTRQFLEDRSVPCVQTPGDGYVADLQAALAAVSLPVLTVAADLPLLDARLVDRVLDVSGGESLALAVPVALKTALGVSHGQSFEADGRRLVPAGINVVSAAQEDQTHPTYDARAAVNVNRLGDAAVASTLLSARRGPPRLDPAGSTEVSDRGP